jgi:maleate isomerase
VIAYAGHYSEGYALATTEELLARFQEILDNVRLKTNATRTTLRLDSEKHGWSVNGIVVESLGAGAMSLKKETGLPQRSSGTATWLEQNRRILVMNDTANGVPKPPKELFTVYGTLAQMMAPVVRGDKMVGWMSVHYNVSPREWSPADVAALEAALAETQKVMDDV